MNHQIGFVIKVLLLSVGISFLIKYGGSIIAIAPTSFNAAIAIALLPLIVALALLGRINWS